MITTLSYLLLAFIVGFTMMRDATGILPNNTIVNTTIFLNETMENVTQELSTITEVLENITTSGTIEYLYGSHNSFQVNSNSKPDNISFEIIYFANFR